jgi:hypothetical protein
MRGKCGSTAHFVSSFQTKKVSNIKRTMADKDIIYDDDWYVKKYFELSTFLLLRWKSSWNIL